jgi:hypothetical protein
MAALDLGPHVSALLRTASSLSEAQLTTTAEAVLQAVCGGASTEQTLAPHSWAQQPAARDAVAAIAAVVTHAASFKLTGDQVKGRQRPQKRTFLTTKVPHDSGRDMHSTASLRDDHGWSEPRAAALTAAYDAARYAAALGSSLLTFSHQHTNTPSCLPTHTAPECEQCCCEPRPQLLFPVLWTATGEQSCWWVAHPPGAVSPVHCSTSRSSHRLLLPLRRAPMLAIHSWMRHRRRAWHSR